MPFIHKLVVENRSGLNIIITHADKYPFINANRRWLSNIVFQY
ncbi:Putative uncharacterized protein [Lactobacillus helveticus CIRM-BIA 101]|nr:hypothetical protein HMPREF0518_1624 [Lactobacillus helveticus DSM 20075 = CGMCC 1.1877]CDI66416.1 Putative uncharacterized protein [Lactobacillus helveticus CIRM-BIA 101]